jgi:hypothetical protein
MRVASFLSFGFPKGEPVLSTCYSLGPDLLLLQSVDEAGSLTPFGSPGLEPGKEQPWSQLNKNA